MLKKILLFAAVCIIAVFDFTASFGQTGVLLNNGLSMPVLGLGTWTMDDHTAEDSVYFALKNGYRLIDTARYYGNEKGVGNAVRRAIKDGIVKREEIFITSKILPCRDASEAETEINESLSSLGLDYVDLMLIHQPGYNDEESYKALEKAVKSGKVKSIGISNYYTPEDFERISSIAEITPSVVQNENHIYYQNTELKDYLKRYGVVIESWYPFGGRGHVREVLSDRTIREIAAKHDKSPAQIILRWQIQAGYVTIPGSKNPKHIIENISVFDFELSRSEMEQINRLNKGKRFEIW